MVRYVLDMRTATPHFPGIGRYVDNLARHLPAHLREGERLTLLAYADNPLPRREDGFPSSQVQTLFTTTSPFSLRQQWVIPSLLRRLRTGGPGAHVYHSPYYLMPYALPCPAVLTIYDLIALLHPRTVSASARALFRIATFLALRTSDRIITISEGTRRDLLASFNVDPARVTTVHLAADDTFFPRSIEEQQALRTAYRLPDDFLLYLGINKPHKNLCGLVDAYASLFPGPFARETSLPSLVIAGAWDTRYPDAKSRAEYYRLGDKVRFLGPVDDADLPALYSATAAFVFPSRYEGFGLPVLEAMACGAPVACSYNSSLPEVAGEAAFYFDAENTDSIAQAIRVISSDSELRHRLSALGLRRSKEFSWSRTASETINIYRSLAPF